MSLLDSGADPVASWEDRSFAERRGVSGGRDARDPGAAAVVDVAGAANLGGFSVQATAPSSPTWTTEAMTVTAAATIATLPGFASWRCRFASAAMAMFRS